MFLFRLTSQHFWELFVHVDSGGTIVCLPNQMPPKYSDRILKNFKDVYWIQSLSHASSTRTNLNSLKKGVWICEGDCQSFGGIQPTLFGILLHYEIQTAFTIYKDILVSWSTNSWVFSRVGYHGTSLENYEKICESGLKSSFGMLGTGVYLGSFWKACRFAVRDQEYKFRTNPSVLRVVWMCNDEDILTFPRKIMYCLCAECYMRPEQRSFCGHTMDWTSEKIFPEKTVSDRVEGQGIRFWAGHLKPCKFPNSSKYVTQNEEWVLNPSTIVRLAECVIVDVNSVSKPHYDPKQRDIKIL